MNLIHCIILGIIQGLTEFIPVSSSAHLVIVQNIFGIKEPQISFDVLLHLATLLAVIIYFRKDIINMAKSVLKPQTEEFKLILLLIAGTIPTAILGFLFKDFFEALFSSPIFPSIFLLITGIILFSTKFKVNIGKDIKYFSFLDAVIIGIAQAIAIAPGISRSGITISSGIFRNIDKKLCAKYSLLLSIPAIIGAILSQISDIQSFNSISKIHILLGFLCAFSTGLLAIRILIKFLEKAKFYMFSYYCFIIGVFSLTWFLFF